METKKHNSISSAIEIQTILAANKLWINTFKVEADREDKIELRDRIAHGMSYSIRVMPSEEGQNVYVRTEVCA